MFGDKSRGFEIPPEPERMSVKDMIGGSTTVASIQAPISPQVKELKRILDMNQLENGPPAKVTRIHRGAPTTSSKLGSTISPVSLASILGSNVASGNQMMISADKSTGIPTLPTSMRMDTHHAGLLFHGMKIVLILILGFTTITGKAFFKTFLIFLLKRTLWKSNCKE